MTWARFEDDFYENPKVAALSHQAFRLYVLAITYCNRKNRRDGFVGAGEARLLCRLHGVAEREHVNELLTATCWHEVDEEDGGGYTIHDFGRYLAPEKPTAEERGRQGGIASAASRRQRFGSAQPRSNPEASPEASPEANPEAASKHSEARRTPVPVPVPVPVSTERGPHARAREADPFLGGITVDTFLDDPAVGAYHEAAKGRGLTVSPAKLALLGASTRELRQRGTSDEVLVGACLRQAERGGDPKRLDIDVEFIERQRTGSIAAQAAAATERLRAGTVGR